MRLVVLSQPFLDALPGMGVVLRREIGPGVVGADRLFRRVSGVILEGATAFKASVKLHVGECSTVVL